LVYSNELAKLYNYLIGCIKFIKKKVFKTFGRVLNTFELVEPDLDKDSVT